MTYKITEIREFYGPKKERHVICDDLGEPLEFSSRNDALAWIDQREGEVYHLSHNESSRPAYKVSKA